jgi:pimeloyl-ACP methyl ester carboxylesterase
MPGFGAAAENTRTANMQELAATMAKAASVLGLDRFNLMGTSFGGKVALWLASDASERVLGLVLEAPAAMVPAGDRPPSGTPAEMARRLFAHPERLPPLPSPDPQQAAQTQAFVRRVFGPGRDPDLESRMRHLKTPTLVVFGTLDAVIPPDFGHLYKQMIPDCYLIFVYDAGHAVGTERPEAFVEVVGDFLDRHDAFVVSRAPTVVHP